MWLICGWISINTEAVVVGAGNMYVDIFPNAHFFLQQALSTTIQIQHRCQKNFLSADSGKPCRHVKWSKRGYDNTAAPWMETTATPTMAMAAADMFRVFSWAQSTALTCLPISKHFVTLSAWQACCRVTCTIVLLLGLTCGTARYLRGADREMEGRRSWKKCPFKSRLGQSCKSKKCFFWLKAERRFIREGSKLQFFSRGDNPRTFWLIKLHLAFVEHLHQCDKFTTCVDKPSFWSPVREERKKTLTCRILLEV